MCGCFLILIYGRLYNKQNMKKSLASRKGSCMSLLTGTCKDEASLELMRISLKKETERKQRLEKLLQKYQQIRASERQHVKTIKSSIIELKDVAPVPKIRFLIDPNIYVDNNLSIETRQFLCMLLNTFYKRYQENADYEAQTAKNNDHIRALIKSISGNEQLLFKVQKQNINSQVQMEGELLSEKSKLKDQNQKARELEAQEKRVLAIWSQKKDRYEQQKKKIDDLTTIACQIQNKIIGMIQKITQGQQIRQGNQDKISNEMVYQMKFQEQVNILKKSITSELQRQSRLKKKIREKRIKIAKIKGLVNYDNANHQVDLKLLDLQQPRPSAKYSGVKQILQIQRSFEKAMSRSQSTDFYSIAT